MERNKFSGKKLVVHPEGGLEQKKMEFTIIVRKGNGKIADNEVEARNFDKDELLICYTKVVNCLNIENTGKENLIIFKLFGPDVYQDSYGK